MAAVRCRPPSSSWRRALAPAARPRPQQGQGSFRRRRSKGLICCSAFSFWEGNSASAHITSAPAAVATGAAVADIGGNAEPGNKRRGRRFVRGGCVGATVEPGCDHGVDYLCDDHAGRRHDDRQCRAAAHSGQPFMFAGPDRLGGHVLHRRRRDHDAPDWLARRPARHKMGVFDIRRRFYARLGLVRRRDQLDAIGALPGPARHVRRGVGALVAIGAAAQQSA